MNIKGMRYTYRQEAGESGESGGGSAEEVVEVAAELAPDIIEKATKMGWTSKEEFRGDPDKWRPADEFVERGENMLPIVRATVKRQEREIAELKQSMKQFAEFHNKTEQRAYEKALSDLKAQRADAIAAGDGETFAKVDDAIDGLKKDIEAKGKQSQQDDSNEDPVFDEWKSRNKWMDDPKMEAFGEAAAQYLRKSGEKATGSEFLDMVTKEVKAKFPEKFENPRRAAAASVEGGAPAARKGGKGYADMPAEARQACDRMAKNGYGDDPKKQAEFKAQYTKQFFEEA